MTRHLLSFLFTSLLTVSFGQYGNGPVEIVYTNARPVAVSRTTDTIGGIPLDVITDEIQAEQRVQTRCNYGNPSANTYETVTVKATISTVQDPDGKIKAAIYEEFLRKIDRAEKYAASNNYKASVVPEYYFYTFDSANIPGIRKLNSGKGNYVIWYIDGYVYKITLTEDNGIGNLNQLLRTNIRIRRHGNLLDADEKIMDIDRIKELLEVWMKE